MANRKKRQTSTILTAGELAVQDEVNANKTQVHLSKSHFNNVVRYLKVCPLNNAQQIRTLTYNTLKRLQVKRDLSKAPKGIPGGSDQFDGGSLLNWMDSILPADTKAVEQVIALDALCCQRES